MNDKQRGLYTKYLPIERWDDSPKHKNCEYFVLDLTHDSFARKAALIYAIFCAEEYPKLAADLTSLVASIKDDSTTDV